MSDHEWRFLTKSSMALGGFEFTPELGLAGGGGKWHAQRFSLGELETKAGYAQPNSCSALLMQNDRFGFDTCRIARRSTRTVECERPRAQVPLMPTPALALRLHQGRLVP